MKAILEESNNIDETQQYMEHIKEVVAAGKATLSIYAEMSGNDIIIEESLWPHSHITSGELCVSQKSQFRGYCWAYSHWKFITIPEIETSVPVNAKVCQRALHQRQYEAPDDKILSVEMGEELVFHR